MSDTRSELTRRAVGDPRLRLAVILLALVVIRLPQILRQPGGQDEEWYAIPGATVAREGIPRVPYSRATEDVSVFPGAERILFAMPPGSFYAQAPFFAVLPTTYGTARLASLAAACVAVCLVFAVTRLLWDEETGLWAALVFSLCRLLWFPAMIARPDMLCGMWGLTTVWCLLKWEGSKHSRWIAAAGVALGLAGLTHPFAIVFAIQTGLWLLLRSGSPRERLQRAASLTLVAALTAGLWTVLIVRAPELFRLQFVNNIIRPAGPGLFMRLINPWSEITDHLPLLIDRCGMLQFVLLTGCGFWVTVAAIFRRAAELRFVGTMAWTAAYILFAAQGDHPLQGYWCYPAAFFCIAAGWCIRRTDEVTRAVWSAKTVNTLWFAVLVCTFVPGSGLRAAWAYARHGHEVNYNSPAFIESVLETLPSNAKLSVGAEFALDAWGLRQDIVLGIRHPLYFDATTIEYDYFILGRSGLEQRLDLTLNGRVVQSFGVRDDPFACYAVVIAPGNDSATNVETTGESE